MKTPGKALAHARIALLCFVCFGCASVPEEAVELSTVVGQRIAAVQASHEAFVSGYFRLSRDRIEEFLTKEWVPHFMATFVQQANLRNEINNVNPFSEGQIARLNEEVSALNLGASTQQRVIASVQSAFGDAERGQIVIEFAQAAMDQIQAQRTELLQPLARQEAKALQELRSSYSELIAMQNAVTAHLSSIRAVTVEQDDVLNRLGLLKARDEAVQKAVSLNDSVVNALDKSQDIQAKLDTLKGLLSN